MNLYQKFKELNIDLSAIGLEQRDTSSDYFCTPKGAKAIGWAGVDGIHYCFVKGFDEIVFAISPMNLIGEQVHPIARSFEDMLSLLLACGSMDAIEQAYMWDEAAFDRYIQENQPGEVQSAAMAEIKEQLGIEPMENPFAYIKELQESFDYNQLRFSSEYYKLLEPVEEQPPEWKVVYEGGFWPRRGRAGKEISVDKKFVWGEEQWHIPAVYQCSGGLVIDCCVKIDPNRIREHTEKWEQAQNEGYSYTEAERLGIIPENPMSIRFRASALVNGTLLKWRGYHGEHWTPDSCRPEGTRPELHAKWTLEHYGLDPESGWSFFRISLPWANGRPRNIKSLSLTLEREMTEISGAPFKAPAVGESVTITNPITGQEHILTVREREAHEFDQSHFRDDSMEYPTHCVELVYTIFPEVEDFYLRDCDQGDNPRPRHPNPTGAVFLTSAIFGFASNDSTNEYIHPDKTAAKVRAFGSSFHFEPVKELKLNIIFREKRIPDIEVQLI